MAAYFTFVTGNRPAFRLLFGASVRNDAEFAEVAEAVLGHMADAVADMIDADLPGEQRTVLAHAIIGMAEAVGRRALRDETAEHDPELLAHWTAELVWYGLRGIRTGPEVATPGTRADL